ncbi:perlucin-like protein [Crassostrea virginica]
MAKYGWSSELTQKMILFSFLWILTKANLVIKNTSLFAADGDFSHLMNPSDVITSMTLISSGVLCLDKPDCVSFLFNPKTKQMQRLSYVGTPSGTGGANVMDWRYYIIKKEPLVCEPGWEKFQDSCYLFSASYGNWNSGKLFCENNGGYMVEITNLAEDTFVRDFVRNRAFTAYETRDSWIGGTDVVTENTFVWIGSGQTFTYSNWGPNNPDNSGGNQHCVILFQPSDYKWHDTQCTNTNSFICEK